jgi:BASS family bile acid:Na+ symporter
MQETVKWAIEATVFALMVIVGIDCTPAGILQSLRRPALLATATLVPYTLFPLFAAWVCVICPLSDAWKGAIMLTACCPSGAISNTYTFIARGSTPLSVTMTLLSSLAALVGTPLAIWICAHASGASGAVLGHVPLTAIMLQIGRTLLLPIFIGLGVRLLLGSRLTRQLRWLRRLSVILIVALIVLIDLSSRGKLLLTTVDAALPALALTGGGLALAWGLSRLHRTNREQRLALLFELPCRNLAIVAVMGISVLDKPEWVSLAAAIFLVQAAVLLTVAIVMGRRPARTGCIR